MSVPAPKAVLPKAFNVPMTLPGREDRPKASPGLALGHAHSRRIGRALLGAGLDGLQGPLDGHCNWKRSFKNALTSSWDLFAAASW